MNPHKSFIVIACLLLAGLIVVSPAKADLPKADPDWPMFIGPGGTRVPTVQGYELVDDLNAVQPVWKLKHHTTVGKGLYPSTLRECQKRGIKPFYGGAANLVIADDIIYLSYYKPNGKHPAKAEGWRTVGNPKEYLPDGFFCVGADDILLAVDANKGTILWEKVEADRGINRLAHKRAHWVRSPAVADGKVFSIGSAGTLYAYDAKSGKALWDVETNPYWLNVKKEHAQARKLCWQADSQSSLVVADGVVIVAEGWLAGYDAKDGKQLWRIKENINSKHATPTLWKHDDKTYVVVHNGTDTIRLIDPANGKVLWTEDGFGHRLGTLSGEGDVLIVTYHSESVSKEPGRSSAVRYGAIELSLAGPKKLWAMDDEKKYSFHWKHDKGPRYRTSSRDGLTYLGVGREDNAPRHHRTTLMVVETRTGKVLSETPMGETLSNPIPMEDKLLVLHDYAHTDPVSQSYWTAGTKPRKLTAHVGMPHRAITGYYIDLEPIYYKGRLYFRTLEGMICYDMRKPAPETSQTLRLRMPDELLGTRDNRPVLLYVRDGKITHGGVPGASRLHAADVSRLTLQDGKLSGMLGVGLFEPTRPSMFEVDATIEGDEVSGTMAVIEKAFDRPIEVSGDITKMPHQRNWMPPATHVLNLEGAARNVNRKPGRLLLLPTIRDGKILHVAAWADHTTKTMPAVYWDDLQIKDGRLVGKVQIRYRPDEWTTPLAKYGSTAGAEYVIDADLDGSGKLGSYKGVYGVGLRRSAKLSGKVE